MQLNSHPEWPSGTHGPPSAAVTRPSQPPSRTELPLGISISNTFAAACTSRRTSPGIWWCASGRSDQLTISDASKETMDSVYQRCGHLRSVMVEARMPDLFPGVHLTPWRNPSGTTLLPSNGEKPSSGQAGSPHCGSVRFLGRTTRPKTSISQSIRPPEEPPADHARRDKQWGASSSPQYGHHIFEEVSHDGQPEGISISHRSVG